MNIFTKMEIGLRAFSRIMNIAVSTAKEFNSQLEKLSHLVKEEDDDEE